MTESSRTPVSPAAGRRAVSPRLVVCALAAVVLVADQVTKYWAESALTDHAPISLPGGFFELKLLYNSGAAFSLGSGSTWIFTVIAGAAVIGLVRLTTRVRALGWAIGLGLLLGGATTHLLHRLFRSPGFGVGHVVDFIDYNGWFVGNVADIALVVGACILVLQGVIGRDLDGQRSGSLTAESEQVD